MYCSSCGAPQIGAAFCTSCGAPAANQQNVIQAPPTSMSPPAVAPQGTTNQSNIFSTLGIIFGAVGFLFLPIVIGVAGIVMSVIAKSKQEPKADVALAISIIGTVLGMIIGALVADSFW